MVSITIAGTLFIKGSATLKCMAIAPSIKTPMSVAAGRTVCLNFSPNNKASAAKSFIPPTR